MTPRFRTLIGAKRPPLRAASLRKYEVSDRLRILGTPRSVFDVARDLMSGALCLVEFAFGLHLFVAGNFPDRILDRALCLIGGAFEVFFVHFSLL
jgi:hypothetical protein